MSRKSSNHTPHEEAVAIIEKLAITNLGGHLEATAACNQCSQELTIDLVAGVSSANREKLMGRCAPTSVLASSNTIPSICSERLR